MAYITKFSWDYDKWWKNYLHNVITSQNHFSSSMQLLYYFGLDPKSRFDLIFKLV